ncbi:MAG: cell division protein [Gammaproteobacteria bacterium]|nr:MAG: cell division protein [Gammaproteobacteria bacterium]
MNRRTPQPQRRSSRRDHSSASKPLSERSRRAPAGGLRMRLRLYFLRHAQAFVDSLGRLRKAPLASTMTVMVIGIALALPTGLYLVVKNLRGFDDQWQSATQLSVFLQKALPAPRLSKLLDELKQDNEITHFEYRDPAAVLIEFSQLADLGDSLEVLDDNPLPGIIIVQSAATDSDAMAKLVDRLEAKAEIDFVQLDRRWLERLYAIVDIGKRSIIVLACLLGLAVVLVAGNTIRLSIEGRRAEIKIIKLIGGTDGFIRRPFLYSGLWYGLFGGVFALILINIALFAIRGPVKALARLYDDGFGLLAVDFSTTGIVILGAILLGWGGSWLAVSRHLRDIQPT